MKDPEDAIDDRAVGLPGVAGPVVGREQWLDEGVVVVAEGVAEFGQDRSGGRSGGMSTPLYERRLLPDTT